MKYKIQKRRVYDDGSFGDWTRWSSKVYEKVEYANQALMYLEPTNIGWGFNFTTGRMWTYEFRITEHSKQLPSSSSFS